MPLVQVEALSKTYAPHGWFWRRESRVEALRDVHLSIEAGSTHALVGESGSGKSTLARCLARLEMPSAGRLWFDGRDLLSLSPLELRSVRREIQLIFQDPAASLSPRFTAAEIVEEPLHVQHIGTRRERRECALRLLDLVGIPAGWSDRRPFEFSGGQRQRLAIARALTLSPRFLILDEAFSALDLSLQAQMVNLLLDLQAARGLTYLYITHDLSLVGHVADEISVLHRGRIVEHGKTPELFSAPRHPQTQALLEAMPILAAGLGR